MRQVGAGCSWVAQLASASRFTPFRARCCEVSVRRATTMSRQLDTRPNPNVAQRVKLEDAIVPYVEKKMEPGTVRCLSFAIL